MFLCNEEFYYALEELVGFYCALEGFAWPPLGVYGVLTGPPWLLPAEVFYVGGKVVCVLISNKSIDGSLRPSLNLSGVSALCLTQGCSVSLIFPLNLFPPLVKLGSSCIPSNAYKSDLNCKMPLSHNSILIHKLKEFKNLPRYSLKNWRFASLEAFTMSMMNYVMSPDSKLVSQKSTSLEIALFVFFSL